MQRRSYAATQHPDRFIRRTPTCMTGKPPQSVRISKRAIIAGTVAATVILVLAVTLTWALAARHLQGR